MFFAAYTVYNIIKQNGVYLFVCLSAKKNTGPNKLKFCIKFPDIRRSNMCLQLPYTFRYRFKMAVVCLASSSLIVRSYLLYPLLRNDILVVGVKNDEYQHRCRLSSWMN